MSVSQLITVKHIIDPQSWVFLRIVVFLLPPKVFNSWGGSWLLLVWGGLILVLFCFVSFKFSCSIFAQTQEV